jgi:hypothetical protein
MPAHVDGWAHFSEGVDEFVAAFDEAGISNLLGVAGSRQVDRLDLADRPPRGQRDHRRPSTRSCGCTQSGERLSLKARKPSLASASLRLLVMPMRSYKPR